MATRGVCGWVLVTVLTLADSSRDLPLGFAGTTGSGASCCAQLCKGQLGEATSCRSKCQQNDKNVRSALAYYVCSKGLCKKWRSTDQAEYDAVKLSDKEMADLGDTSDLGIPFMKSESLVEVNSEVAEEQEVDENFCAGAGAVCSELCTALGHPLFVWRLCKWKCMANWKELSHNKKDYCENCGGLQDCHENFHWVNGKCEECEKGRWSSGKGFCLDCPPGSAGKSTGPGCHICDGRQGEYSTVYGAQQCQNCNDKANHTSCAGKCDDKHGGISCTACGKGSEGGVSGKRDKCEDCPTGKYAGQNTTCQDCDEGKFNHWKGQQKCYTCANRKWQDARGKDTCKDCNGGEKKGMHTGKEHKKCEVCKDGTKPSTNGQECDNCTKGKAGTLGKCKKCDGSKNQFQDKQGQAECGKCQAGKSPNPHWWQWSGPQACATCKAGKYSPGGTPVEGDLEGGVCKACPMGYYCKKGSTAPQPCPGGTSTGWGIFSWTNWKKESEGDCKKCSLGEGSVTNQVTDTNSNLTVTVQVCQDCAFGKYQDEEGKELKNCKICPGNVNTTNTGSTSKKDCLMPTTAAPTPTTAAPK